MPVEILNGVERRRRWSEDEKARIIEESFTAGAKVSDVARKHGVSRGLIFAWRKEARVDRLTIPAVPRLIPVQLAASSPLPSLSHAWGRPSEFRAFLQEIHIFRVIQIKPKLHS